MNKGVFRLLGLALWFAAAGGAYYTWQDIVDWGNSLMPDQGPYVAAIGIFMFLFFLVVAWSWLEDRVVKSDDSVAADARSTAAKKPREQVEKEVEELLATGDKLRAMNLAEQYELYSKAAEIARDLGDKLALVRIFSKMGHHDRARRYSIELKDYEAAAQSSALMGEINTARELYKEAASFRDEEGASPLVVASLWDRAGDYETAASIYEKAGDLEKAAECYEILQDTENAKRLREHANVLKAYERRKTGDSVVRQQFLEGEMKEDLVRTAQLLESIGDFLGAGQAYREAGQHIEAAVVFERMQEWERAAQVYDKIGLNDRAALARTRIEKKAKPDEPTSSTDPVSSIQPPSQAPQPGSMVPHQFVPAEQQLQYVPVFTSGPQKTASPETATRIAQRVRRGNFDEAAHFAMDAGDYLMAAALYERAGNLLKAADIYRKIGKVNDALYCLEQANRPREAAMMSMAMGDPSRSIKVLSDALEKGDDPEAGFLLGDFLIQGGKLDDAMKLLKEKLAPGGVTEENAIVYYRFARMFEDEGASKEAYELYCEMIIAGAESDDVSERQARLALEVAGDVDEEEVAGEIPSLASVGASATAPALSGNSPTSFSAPKMFSFIAPEEMMKQSSAAAARKKGVPQARQEMSLFGEPEGFEDSTQLQSGVAASKTADSSDPFARQHRYDIKRELARGGMGVIYEAEDTSLGRMVALKLIQGMEGTPEAHQQFLLEARAIARLSHPNVVTIYDIGLMDLKHYITMELIKGKSLQEHIDQNKKLPLKAALQLFVEMSRGLQAAHEQGIIHRDIKPGNILLNDKSQVKIVDFGLAKLGAGAEEGMDKTIFKMSGTPGYMAPEQIDGEESMPRTDIYALGITFFTMLAGQPPHALQNKTKPRQIIAFQLAGKLPSLKEVCPDVPPAIDEIYQYCTTSNAEERYQGIDQFLPAAEQWLAAF